MRKLLITRGIQGSGKSTALRNLGLEEYILSPDIIRAIVASPVMDAYGKIMVSHDDEDMVWSILANNLDRRMNRGEFVAIDATHRFPSDLDGYIKLAEKHLYDIACLDFTDFPLNEAITRDAQRPEARRVGQKSIRRFHDDLTNTKQAGETDPSVIETNSKVTFIRWTPDDPSEIERAARDWMKPRIVDLSGYRRVHHIGDIQGCYDVLFKQGSPLASGFDDRDFYVFVGDFLDRGLQNGEVMRWAVDDLIHRDNVAILWGNHEDHIHLWASGRKAVSGEFEHNTLPQLKRAGLDHKDARAFVAKLRDSLFYAYGDARVMVTHAGLATVPERPELISSRQYATGTGHFSFPVDQQFAANTSKGGSAFDGSDLSKWWQVHGHRNHNGQPTIGERSINLEGSVEFGGELKAATFDGERWTASTARNTVFKPYRERKHMQDEIVPPWMSREGESGIPPVTSETIEELRTAYSKYIREMKFGDVSSFNFNKKAFWDRVWNGITVKARGLYINTALGEVVARGYPKFFNVGEMDDPEDEGIAPTTMEKLKDSLVFPVSLYVKENGFFGVVGYDRGSDSLVVGSKSVLWQPEPPEGLDAKGLEQWEMSQQFPRWFKAIFDKTFTEEQQETMRRELRDKEMNFIFEINDPVNDPHMIEYDEAHLVLLDAPRRSMDFELLPYDMLVKTASKYGVKVKEKGMTFKDWKSFNGWYQRATSDMNFTHKFKDGRREHIEGYVFEDASGFQSKIKLPYYAFWKRMRSLKDRILKIRGTDQELKRDISSTEAKQFYDWAVDQPEEILAQDIISVRKCYEADMASTCEEEADSSPASSMGC